MESEQEDPQDGLIYPNMDHKVGFLLISSKCDDNSESSTESDSNLSSSKWEDQWVIFGATNFSNLNSEETQEELRRINMPSEDSDGVTKLKKLFKCNSVCASKTTLLDHPQFQNHILEMHLDGIFKDQNKMVLSNEIFKCVNLRVLSLKSNNLRSLPVDVGRLTQLETLLLTENCLTFNNIPYTLTFCTNLKKLYLDHNMLEALPGFLLDMPHLDTVYRHGNDNYFKSTFMWFHTEERDRVMPLRPSKSNMKVDGKFQPQSLQLLAIKSVVEMKINFFTPGLLPETLQDYIAQVYRQFKICAFCGTAFHDSKTGFGVFTFKSPYVGNSCVPFEFWACSRECGVQIEEPSHRLEMQRARQQDTQYEQYIRGVEDQLTHPNTDRKLKTCILM